MKRVGISFWLGSKNGSKIGIKVLDKNSLLKK